MSVSLSHILVPVVNTLLDNAWNAACEHLRSKGHESHIDAAGPADKVKFELKEVGDKVADWDRYRWKVSHAVDQYNRACDEVMSGIRSAPCDGWVRVWAKSYYLGARIQRLRASVAAMRAICDATSEWLDSVEKSCASSQSAIKAQYDKDVSQLKTMQVHDTCAETKCMFKRGAWTSSPLVPTSDMATYFIKAVKTVVEVEGPDVGSMAVDMATALKG